MERRGSRWCGIGSWRLGVLPEREVGQMNDDTGWRGECEPSVAAEEVDWVEVDVIMPEMTKFDSWAVIGCLGIVEKSGLLTRSDATNS